MKRVFFLALLLALGQLVSAQTNKVLLIGIDGCRPDAMMAADTPALDALLANGTYSLDALNTGVTYSGPGWASLLTGVWPEKHGVTDNSFVGSDFLNYPHLFQRIEEHDSSLETVSISQWHPVNDEIATGVADVVINVDDHTDYVTEEAVNQLSTGNPDAMFLHFDDVDHAGHAHGFSPNVPEYISAIETVDDAISEVLSALYARESYDEERWVIIVSTDHGGLGYSHGGNSIEERKIFMIVSGDDIANAVIAADSIETLVPPVFNCLGDSIALFFENESYAQSTSSELFDFGANQDFTIECRVRTDQSGDVAIITDKDWDSGLNPGWVFSFNVNGGPWKVNVGDGSNRVDVEGNEIADGEWHMLSASFDRDSMLSIYEDGILVNEASMAALGDVSASNQIIMGADIDLDYGYSGYIAEVRIFNGLVSPETIADWSCEHLTVAHPAYPNLVSQWAMNEGQESELWNDGANALATYLSGGQWLSAMDTLSVWELDYSNTPRQVDFMVSALEHMCIPNQVAWDLDGQVLATYCQSTPDGLKEEALDWRVYPNPTQDEIQVKGLADYRFELYDSQGKLVLSTEIKLPLHSIDLTALNPGTYEYQAQSVKGRRISGKLNILR